MVVGTLFTLFVVPVFYLLIAGERHTDETDVGEREPAVQAQAIVSV